MRTYHFIENRNLLLQIIDFTKVFLQVNLIFLEHHLQLTHVIIGFLGGNLSFGQTYAVSSVFVDETYKLAIKSQANRQKFRVHYVNIF